MKLEFRKTCDACPEQYDVFVGDRQVAYVRLRWSQLTVQCPDVGGDLVFAATIGDSGYDGCFEDEMQRQRYWQQVEAAILDWMEKKETADVESNSPKR